MVLLQYQYKEKERAHIAMLRFEYKFGLKIANLVWPDFMLTGILLLNSSFFSEQS
jgi:hypothetical protein